MLQQIGQNIWVTDGTQTAESFGFCYPLRMAVVRLTNGGLWIWSPIALTPELANEIAPLGKVSHIICPNAFHHLSASDWISAYPDAKLSAAPGLVKRRPDLTPNHTLGDGPAPWDEDIKTVMFRGNVLFEEAVFFHAQSGTLIFTDLLQNIPADMLRGWRKVIARLDLMTGKEPHVPRKFRLAFRDKPALRRALSDVSALPVQRVIMAHGAPVTQAPQAFLARAFSWV